ncbi:MAG TPA: hypothetical protein PL009_06520 [Flavipsychrobacter sp.]|nr:hypothetical protein [Flavipsychrobacter sp.]
MKSILFALGLAVVAFPAVAQEHSSHYEKSVFTGFHKIEPSTRSDANHTIQQVKQHFPDMMQVWTS